MLFSVTTARASVHVLVAAGIAAATALPKHVPLHLDEVSSNNSLLFKVYVVDDEMVS